MLTMCALSGCGGQRLLPRAEGPVDLAQGGLPQVTVRVSEAVLAVGDPRYRPEDKGWSRYAADNDPWRWTDEQRTLAAALDLRDLLTRMLCGPDHDLAYAVPGS